MVDWRIGGIDVSVAMSVSVSVSVFDVEKRIARSMLNVFVGRGRKLNLS